VTPPAELTLPTLRVRQKPADQGAHIGPSSARGAFRPNGPSHLAPFRNFGLSRIAWRTMRQRAASRCCWRRAVCRACRAALRHWAEASRTKSCSRGIGAHSVQNRAPSSSALAHLPPDASHLRRTPCNAFETSPSISRRMEPGRGEGKPPGETLDQLPPRGP
jgi:hypothetical protein